MIGIKIISILVVIVISVFLFNINTDNLHNNVENVEIKNRYENQIYNNSAEKITEDTDKEINMDNIYIKMKENSLTSKGLILTIENKNDDVYLFNEIYEIQRKENNEWIKYLSLVQRKAEPDMYIDENEIKDVEVTWEREADGELSKGEYRLKILVKNNYPDNDVYHYIDFIIE